MPKPLSRDQPLAVWMLEELRVLVRRHNIRRLASDLYLGPEDA